MTDQMRNEDIAEVRTRMWKKLSDSPFLMIGLEDAGEHSVPMTAQLDPEADGTIWFFTQHDNRLAAAGPAMAQFVSKDHKLFACLRGTLVAETDPARIDKHWSTFTEAWFEGGRNDPRLIMLRFDLDDAEIWEGDESIVGKFKMLTGMKIKPEEAGRHVETAL